MHHRRATIFAVSAFLALCAARAQAAPGNLTLDANSPVQLRADSLQYFPEERKVAAQGNVEIIHGERILLAEQIIYDQNTNTVIAPGKVTLMEPSGDVFFAQDVRLKDDLQAGVIQNFRVRLSNNSLVAARQAVRPNPTTTDLSYAVYSPCKLCAEDPTKAPLWQIKARKVRIDEAKEKMSYKDARMEVYGVPVMYTPYFSHPTPDARRKSGFLAPSYSSISTLGFMVEAPYYWNIAPEMDATITPIYTSKEGPVLSGAFRHLTQNGAYQLRGSMTNPDKRDDLGNPTDGQELRGHIEGAGNFNLENDWSWGFYGKRASDDTYLRRYRFGDEDLLTSSLYAEQIRNRNYLGVRGITFQGLNQQDDPSRTPLVLPLADAHYEMPYGPKGARFTLDSNMMSVYRSVGPKSRRISLDGGYTIPHIFDNGQVLELSAALRGDAYHVGDVESLEDPTFENGETGRAIPSLSLEWSYPLVRQATSSTIVIEPVAAFVLSPYGGNPDKIPNEDSQYIEISDTNLMEEHKFTGLDRVESGPRFNYGVRGSADVGKTALSFLVGQSYRVKEDHQFALDSGLDDNASNIVGRTQVSYDDWFDILYRFRLDEADLDIGRSEVLSRFTLDRLSFGLNYAYFDAKEETSSNPSGQDFNEISSDGTFRLTNTWSLQGYTRRDLGDDGGLISAAGGLLYEDECFRLSTLFGRDYTRDRDIEPSTFFTVRVYLASINTK